ncbi:MAG: nickel-dependent lactate racemase [Candidatus Jordarchaeales archaeon]|nr:nickel-dependent lactate racemase [Candidatus Jordarchaeia archaeon]
MNVDGVLLSGASVAPSSPLGELVEESLRLPVKSKRVEELDGGSAVILVDDYTRTTPVREILPVVLERLKVDGDVSVVVASGTHRKMSEEELKKKIGEVYWELPVFQHDPDERLVFLGETSRGTPVWINELAARADVLVSIGSVAPHNFYGWSGGAKIVLPGVAGRESISCNHKLAEHPDARLGNPESPARLDAEEAAKKLRTFFSINVVKNVRSEVVHVSSGDVVAAHRAAVEVAMRVIGVKAPWASDVTIVSSHPYDNDLWQAGKALFSAANITREGGTIILLSPMREGVCVHYPQFERLLSLPPEEISKEAASAPLEATVALQIKRMQERFNCIIISDGVTGEQAERMGFKWFSSPQEAIDQSLKRNGRVTVIPNQLIYPYR